MSTTSVTKTAANWVVETTHDDMPAPLREIAVRPIIDTVGAIVAGSSGPAGSTILEYADQLSPRSDADVTWTGTSSTLTPEVRALVASTLAHALDYDDEMSGVGHPSPIVLSAILSLPLAEPLSGRRLVEAYVIGFEIIAKVAKSIGMRHYKIGWHTTVTGGGFGAAAACCKLLGLSEEQTRTAFGLVATFAGGLQRNFGTMTKPLHSGLAARNGVLAAQLAQVGFTADTQILDGAKGFLDIYGAGQSVPEAIGTLGNPYALENPGPSLKKYPCCYATHRVIDAILDIQGAIKADIDDLERIAIVAPTDATIPLRYPDPETGLQGKFSMPFVVGSAFVDGQVVLDTFADENVARPDIRAVMERIDVREDPRCRPEDPTGENSSSGTGGFFEVTVRTKNGQEEMRTVHYPTGSPKKPLSWEDLEAKFAQCLAAGGRDATTGMAVYETLKQIEEVADVHALLAKLA